MTFLCVSDQIDPLVYSTSVKERYGDVDAVFCAGDVNMDYVDFIVSTLNKPVYFVFGNHNLSEYTFYEKSHKVQFIADASSVKNHASDYSHVHGGDYAGRKVLKDRHLTFTNPATGKKTPLLIAGISGSIRYNKGQSQFTDREMFFQLLGLIPKLLWNKIRYGRYLDIFLTHSPPRHLHDKEDACHKGFKCFRWFLKKFRPPLMIHGHIHLYDIQQRRTIEFEDTKIINAFSHVIIEMKEKESKKSKKGEKLDFTISCITDR